MFLFISCFTVSVTPSINTPESSSDLMILIISFISSFEMNKVNHFPALAAPIFFQIYLLHSKLYHLLIQLNYLQQKEQQHLLVLKIPHIKLFQIFELYLVLYMLTYCQQTHFLFQLFILLLEIINEAILRLESFSQLLLFFQSYFLLQILICLVVYLLV